MSIISFAHSEIKEGIIAFLSIDIKEPLLTTLWKRINVGYRKNYLFVKYGCSFLCKVTDLEVQIFPGDHTAYIPEYYNNYFVLKATCEYLSQYYCLPSRDIGVIESCDDWKTEGNYLVDYPTLAWEDNYNNILTLDLNHTFPVRDNPCQHQPRQKIKSCYRCKYYAEGEPLLCAVNPSLCSSINYWENNDCIYWEEIK
ncbi:hypothetical protein [Moorena sp. SIO3A2]|uniref:hypothetical protein n=1 Tax=Moorena sp. SIO3A2 TaxID=2607841 RepID=UPI0013BA03F5|nr:hypothetical protein [Moorena sp. SIO3A2]NER91561.1 hypothetical protein [Moorena sp. SIO3A2]